MPVLTVHPSTPREMMRPWRGRSCTIGRGAANDVQLDHELISTFHARIEQRDDGFWIIDLNSSNGTQVNDQPVKDCLLRDGDTIRLGEMLEIRFTLLPEEINQGREAVSQPVPLSAGNEALQRVDSGTGMMPQGTLCRGCGAIIPFQVNFCPRCGSPCGQQTLPVVQMPMMTGPLGEYVRPMEAPGQGVGIMPLLAFLCGLSVIGFPFAIILGLVALAQIRKYGGFGSDRKQATWGVGLGCLWAVLFVVAGLFYFGNQYARGRREEMAKRIVEKDKDIARSELSVIDDLKSIARAERFTKVIHFKDAQQTGVGQYADLAELAAVGTTYFPRELASGKSHGYRFSVHDITDKNFIVTAEPEVYGETGKRCFSIDASGVVRAEDLQGKTVAQSPGPWPALGEVKGAFEGMDDFIAAEAIAFAKKQAEAGKYDLVRQILDDVRDQFAMTTAAQDLQALRKSVDPFIVEAQAQNKYQQAQQAVADGDIKRAIGLLKDITELYPSFTKVALVTEELNKHQTTLVQKMDSEAKSLFERAEQFERDGKPEAALDLYVQIEKNYPDTDWAKRMVDLKPAVQQSIREKSAEQLLIQARNLPLDSAFRDVVNALDQLKRNYADTEYVRLNEKSIESFHQKALAQLYRSQAVEQMNAGHDNAALARLEEATTKNADLRIALKDLFLKLYIRVAQKRLDEGDEREALGLYRKYIALEPVKSEINPAVLSRLNFVVAKSEYALGNVPVAKQNLLAARTAYAKDPEFNDLFGSVELALGNYDDALNCFDRAIATNAVANYYARRGYARILVALQTEQEALVAFAGLIRAPQPVAPAEAPAEPGDEDMGPQFTSILPVPVTGKAPEARLKYDAMAAQKLRGNILEFLNQLRGSPTPPPRERVRRPLGGTNTPPAGADGSPSGAESDRPLDSVSAGVELGNALSALHQAILDNQVRKKRTATALRQMAQLFQDGNRDLARAIQANADHAPELGEIRKAALAHEKRIAEAAPKIAAYLETEIDVLDRAYQVTEQMYRTMRVKQLGSPVDPTATLEVYFSKLFDRRDFDRGVQLLREAGEVKVPLEGYAIIPAAAAPDAGRE